MIKKSKTLFFFICIFSFWSSIFNFSFAAPVGNPAGPVLVEGTYPTKFSLETETVLERKLESDSSGEPKLSGTFYTGKLSLYLGKKLDVYGFAGTYEGKVKNFINKTYIIDSKTDVMWGFGVSYILHEFEFKEGILRLGADAKYRQYEPDIDSVKYYREEIDTNNKTLTFKEWQMSLGLAYQYKSFIPYCGIKYSDVGAHIEFTQGGTTYSDSTLSAKNNWGLFYGLDVLLKDNLSLNIEGRSIDEKAANIGMSARF